MQGKGTTRIHLTRRQLLGSTFAAMLAPLPGQAARGQKNVEMKVKG